MTFRCYSNRLRKHVCNVIEKEIGIGVYSLVSLPIYLSLYFVYLERSFFKLAERMPVSMVDFRERILILFVCFTAWSVADILTGVKQMLAVKPSR